MEIRTIENKDDYYQREYINFIKSIFPSADFTIWYEKGFWSDNYKPVSIIENGKIISNIGLTLMDILINDKKVKGIQLGGVGTLINYRNKGYSRKLMEYVFNEYKNKTDLFFLFANETVLNFYPKFGFKTQEQYIFLKYCHKQNMSTELRKLNLQKKEDYALLIGMLNKRCAPTGIFGAENYTTISMWHIFNYYEDCLYFSEDYETILVLKQDNSILNLYEVISERIFDLEEVLIGFKDVTEIRLYFSPDKYHFSYDRKITYEDSPLFISENINFRSDIIKFPELAMT